MRPAARIFWILGVFFALVAAAYGTVTGVYEPWGIEMVGLATVIALSGLGFLIAIFLTLTGRHHSFGSADSLDGEVEDEPGVQGSFSPYSWRSEEHTSELQSRGHLVCRLLLEKKKKKTDKSRA